MANAILREQAEALIKEQIMDTIFQDDVKGSVFMQMATKLPNMTSGTTRIPVLNMLPNAYWVNGDTGLKQTSEQAWENVYMDAGELAVIVPIPTAVINDASFDIIGQVLPRVSEAIYREVDNAIFFGTHRPAQWRNDIITAARQAGNNVAYPTSGTDLFDAILGENGVFGKVEAGGKMVTGAIASPSLKAALRGLRDGNGYPIFMSTPQAGTDYQLDNTPIEFVTNGAFDDTVARLIAGDWSQAVYAIRQDIDVKILEEGVITEIVEGKQEIKYNLPQQDMVALRVYFRMGWAIPNPATALDGDRVQFPFAYLEPASAVTTHTYTVTVQNSSSAAIADAIVDVNGSRLKTNNSGVAVFNLRDATYPVKVTKKGYGTQQTSVTMNGSNATATVTLS